MKVALVNTFLTRHPTPPLGIGYISSVLKNAGHDVRIFDLNTVKNFEKEIESFGPDLAGFSVPTVEYQRSLKYAKMIKKANPNVMVIFGGPHPTVMPRQTLHNPEVDYVCMGEGEYTTLDLANGKDPKKVKGLYGNSPRPFIQDLDELPYPDRKEMNIEWYLKNPPIAPYTMPYLVIHAHRGCPFNCLYCQPTAKKMFGPKMRMRKPSKIVEEANVMAEKYKPNTLAFSADTFTAVKKWTMVFCREYIKNGPDIKFWVNGRVGSVDREMVKSLKRAGCHCLAFGIESGNQKILDFLRRGMTVQQIKDTFKMVSEEGMLTFGNIMIGHPIETEQSLIDSFRILQEIELDYIGGPYITNPIPGTELYDYAIEHGMYSFKGDYLNFTRSGQGNMRLENFTNDELMERRNELIKMLFRMSLKLIVTRRQHRNSVAKKLLNMMRHLPAYIDNTKKARTGMGVTNQRAHIKLMEMFIKGI